MKQKRVSARALAKDLGLSAKTVQEWVGPGGRMPRNATHLRALSEYFDTSVHYLLFGEDDPKSALGAILDKTEIHTGLYEITIKKVKGK
jgi:transcriptional regulator with XRE-family HTH domain